MNKQQCSDLLKRIKRIYPMFQIPEKIDDARNMLNDWYDILASTSFDNALDCLKKYAGDPDNKFPPHPGALVLKKSEFDRYLDHMRVLGSETIDDWERTRKNAVGPTPEQKERVRRYVGRI